MADIIQIRRDTAANWTTVGPTLANGEIGYETDTDLLKFGDGVTAWASLGYFLSGVYEPADATILKDADIGVTVQAYDATIVVDADIGVTVQAYSATNALTSDITYGQLDTNGDVGTGVGQLAIGNHTHTGVYEPADATILKDADIDVTVLGASSQAVDSAKTDALSSATTVVDVSAAAAPAANQHLVATSSTAATWQALDISKDTTPTLGGDLNGGSFDINTLKNVTFVTEVANTGTTPTINWTAGQKQKMTITAATTVTFTAPAGTCNLTLKVINGGLGVITWPAAVDWPGGTEPSWTSAGTDICSFYYDGTTYFGMAGLAFA